MELPAPLSAEEAAAMAVHAQGESRYICLSYYPIKPGVLDECMHGARTSLGNP